VNRYLKVAISKDSIVHKFSGVRPLYDDNAANPSAVTRDYVFDVEGTPPLLSVFGGKITTYRKLAEHALDKLKPFFPAMKEPWTASAPLPGGDMPDADFDVFLASCSGNTHGCRRRWRNTTRGFTARALQRSSAARRTWQGWAGISAGCSISARSIISAPRNGR
jgi:glycerol-3-phosphate dehydrogenase